MKKSIHTLLFVLLLCFVHQNGYAQSEIPQKTVIFIDISKSMEQDFSAVQYYIITGIIPALPDHSSLKIYKCTRGSQAAWHVTHENFSGHDQCVHDGKINHKRYTAYSVMHDKHDL